MLAFFFKKLVDHVVKFLEDPELFSLYHHPYTQLVLHFCSIPSYTSIFGRNQYKCKKKIHLT